MRMAIEEKYRKADEVLRIIKNPPENRTIRDPDTILADFVHEADMEETGLAKEVVELWKKCEDKPSFEALFDILAGQPFEAWLDAAMEGSTK